MTQPGRRYLPEEGAYIQARYLAGDSVEDIAKALHRTPNSVWLWMARAGVRRDPVAIGPELARDIAALHGRDPSLSDHKIARELGCNAAYVRYVLNLPCTAFREMYGALERETAA